MSVANTVRRSASTGHRSAAAASGRSAAPADLRPLPRAFFERGSLAVARDLVGRLIVRGDGRRRIVGRIVEVEAYGGAHDPASHAFRGPTARNAVMFGPPGMLYVYFTYGMHHCANVVCLPNGRPSAVLIRAIAPVEGHAVMRRRRGVGDDDRLGRGPGCVARSFGLDLRHNGVDLTRGPVWIAREPARRDGLRLVRSRRIGIRLAAERPWRFWLAGHPCVSGPRAVGG